MEREPKTPANGENDWQQVARSRYGSSDYAGVIAEDGDKRLIWFHAKDRPPRYAVQRSSGRRWVACAASRSAAHINAVLTGPDPLKASSVLARSLCDVAENADDYAGERPARFVDLVPQGSAKSRAALSRRQKSLVERRKRRSVR